MDNSYLYDSYIHLQEEPIMYKKTLVTCLAIIGGTALIVLGINKLNTYLDNK